MKLYALQSLFLSLATVFALQAQQGVGYGFKLSHDYAFYRQYQQPNESSLRQTPASARLVKQVMDVVPSVDAGFFIISEAGMFSLSGGIAYAPFSKGKYNPNGKGALTIPTLLRFSRYGGVFGKGIGFSAGLGVQFTKTELFQLKGSDNLAPHKPFFRTYIAELEFNLVLGGNFAQSGLTRIGAFTRAGWCPHLDALSLETGLRYTIDVPFDIKTEYIMHKPISLVLPGDLWPAMAY